MPAERSDARKTLRVGAGLVLVLMVAFVCAHIPSLNATTVALSFLLATLFIATRWSLLEAVVASIAAMLCFNFFFLPPVGTFTIADPQNWVALAVFLITAVIASHLSNTAKKRTLEAIQRRAEIERLYNLSRALMLLEGAPAGLAGRIAEQVASIFDVQAVAVFDKHAGEVRMAGPKDLPVPESRLRDACLQNTVLQENDVAILPLRLGGNPVGSLGIESSSISDTGLHSIANLVAIAFERARNVEAEGRAEAARQSQELKSTLLDAVAHEFKTPLTSIKAAVSSLLSSPSSSVVDPELLAVIGEETDRLITMVTEAIDMARIEAGDVRVHGEPQQPAVIVRGAVRKIESMFDGRRIEVQLAESLPECMADAGMIQNVLVLLLDNSVKYAGPGTAIRVSARLEEGAVVFTVADDGPGIPEDEQARVFEKFYRCARDRQRITGTGMGLSIARGIVEAHGGRIWFESRAGAGARFHFSLPLAGAGIPR